MFLANHSHCGGILQINKVSSRVERVQVIPQKEV